MNNENGNMVAADQQKERIRQSYCHILKTYLQLHEKYTSLKATIIDDELKKYFHLLDYLFLDSIGKIKWDSIRLLMPLNLEENIKKEYEMLSENEIRLCCLILFNATASDIAAILPFTRKSIYVVTNRIKKKTGMKDIREDLKSFVIL